MRIYSTEFRLEIVRRILKGEKVAALSRELGIHRKLLYGWVRRVNEEGESSLRARGRPRKDDGNRSTPLTAPQRIAELERTVAHQQLIIDFFRCALQRVEESGPAKSELGATASSV